MRLPSKRQASLNHNHLKSPWYVDFGQRGWDAFRHWIILWWFLGVEEEWAINQVPRLLMYGDVILRRDRPSSSAKCSATRSSRQDVDQVTVRLILPSGPPTVFSRIADPTIASSSTKYVLPIDRSLSSEAVSIFNMPRFDSAKLPSRFLLKFPLRNPSKFPKRSLRALIVSHVFGTALRISFEKEAARFHGISSERLNDSITWYEEIASHMTFEGVFVMNLKETGT